MQPLSPESALVLSVLDRMQAIRAELEGAPAYYHVPKTGLQIPDILAVTKTQPIEALLPLLEAGHRLFGENRVQEAVEKYGSLRERFADIELHLIGPVQSNKAEDALACFDVIQSLDREKIAVLFSQLLQPENGMEKKAFRTTRFYVQINTGEEPQKAGIFPRDADGFIDYCKNVLNLPVEGLMCIPPVAEDAALHFALLRTIATRNGLVKLSMGMSADYRLAASMGSTLVRIGSALFGERG